MWLCYGVHITVCMALLVCVLCQPVHSCIEPSLHGVDFFLEIFLWRFVSVLLIFNNLLCGTAHVIAVDVLSAHACVDKWCPTTSTLCPLSLPHKKVVAQLCSKQSSKGTSSENFVTIGGCFERYTYRVTAPGCLKKERRRWEQF